VYIKSIIPGPIEKILYAAIPWKYKFVRASQFYAGKFILIFFYHTADAAVVLKAIFNGICGILVSRFCFKANNILGNYMRRLDVMTSNHSGVYWDSSRIG